MCLRIPHSPHCKLMKIIVIKMFHISSQSNSELNNFIEHHRKIDHLIRNYCFKHYSLTRKSLLKSLTLIPVLFRARKFRHADRDESCYVAQSDRKSCEFESRRAHSHRYCCARLGLDLLRRCRRRLGVRYKSHSYVSWDLSLTLSKRRQSCCCEYGSR